MASSDEEVEIVTPSKSHLRRITDEDDSEMAVDSPAEDSLEALSSGRKRKHLVVVDQSDEDEEIVTEHKRMSRPSTRRQSLSPVETPPSRRASRRLSDKHEASASKQKVQFATLDNCLKKEEEFIDASESADDEGNDTDNFVAAEGEVEYMTIEEADAVIDLHDEIESDDDGRAFQRFGGTRKKSEWFAIYMDYLENCLSDEEYEISHRESLFRDAEEKVERPLCQRRDSLRCNVYWPDELVEAIENFPQLSFGYFSSDNRCDACNRDNHNATVRVTFSGIECNALKLYQKQWSSHLMNCWDSNKARSVTFNLGSVCFNRILLYWSLLQAKTQWCTLIYNQMKQAGGVMSDNIRDKFHSKEYNRLEELQDMVDKFATTSTERNFKATNVWKGIRYEVVVDSVPRREIEDDSDEDKIDLPNAKTMPSPIGTPDNHIVVSSGGADREESRDDYDEEDLPLESDEEFLSEDQSDKAPSPCLICKQRPQDCAMLHGYYVHIYCCFECGKNVYNHDQPCQVCNRPIEKVVHVLPLSSQAERWVRKSLNKKK
ncbi:hypothetical protein THRCLA_04787 [Thraustotheca clavata]|uniref:DUF4211 domain-containing protein n=1 Tax=Thraustotheca clavata TaxID=74557 RepID=A0A1V9ZY53_9STRA|nr:hypothetical protein THRCLA_04787 [Thraustotheca clavata]